MKSDNALITVKELCFIQKSRECLYIFSRVKPIYLLFQYGKSPYEHILVATDNISLMSIAVMHFYPYHTRFIGQTVVYKIKLPKLLRVNVISAYL